MKYSNIILDFNAVLVLIFGLILGQTICWGLLNLFSINPHSGLFSILSYILTFSTPIIFYNYLIIKRNNGHSLNFDIRSKPFSVYLTIFPMMFGMMLMADFVTQQIPTEGFLFGAMYQSYISQLESMSLSPVSLVITTVICAPILEEIIFRGIIQKGLINNGLNPKIAIIVTAFIFGAIHIYPWQFVGGFMLSLVLGLVYYKTKSLLMPILLHAFNNLISVLSMLMLETSDLSDILKLKNEYLFLLGIIIFVIPTYFFLKKRYIINNN